MELSPGALELVDVLRRIAATLGVALAAVTLRLCWTAPERYQTERFRWRMGALALTGAVLALDQYGRLSEPVSWRLPATIVVALLALYGVAPLFRGEDRARELERKVQERGREAGR